MPRFVTDSRPISAQHPLTEFYREEFLKHHRCLQQQRPYYSESAITDVEAALTRIMGKLEQLSSQDNADTARQLPPQEIRRRHRPFGLVRPQTHTLTRSTRRSSTRSPGHRPGRYRCGATPTRSSSAALAAGAHRGPRSGPARLRRRHVHRRRQGRAGDGRGGRARGSARAIRAGLVDRRRRAASRCPPGSNRSSAAIRCRPPRAKRAGRRALALAGVARRRRDAARAAVRRRVGADGGAGRRHHARRQARDDRAAAARRRRHPRAQHRAQASVGDQGRLAGGARAAAPCRTLVDLRRRRRRPERHRVRADGRRRQHASTTRSTSCGGSAARRPIRRPSSRACSAARDGAVAETPKPGDPRLARATTTVIGSRRDAMAGAPAEAAARGYHVAAPRRAGRRRGAHDGRGAPARGAGARRRTAAVRPASSRAARRRCTSPGTARAGAIRSSRSPPPTLLAAPGVAGRRRQRRHRRHRRPDRRRRRARRFDDARPRRAPPASSPEPLSLRQQRLRVFRRAGRSHPHRSDRHERRRPPSNSVSLNSDVFTRSDSRADARAGASSRRHARAPAGSQGPAGRPHLVQAAHQVARRLRRPHSDSRASASACPRRWTCTSAGCRRTRPATASSRPSVRSSRPAATSTFPARTSTKRCTATASSSASSASRTAAAPKGASSASSSAPTSSLVGRYDRDDNGMGYVVPFDRRVLMDIFVPPGQEGGASPGEMVIVELTRWPTADARRDRPRRRGARRHRRARRRHRDHHPQVRHSRRALARGDRRGGPARHDGRRSATSAAAPTSATCRRSRSTASTRATSTMRSRSRSCRTATSGSACTSPTSRTTCRRAARSIARPTSAARRSTSPSAPSTCSRRSWRPGCAA